MSPRVLLALLAAAAGASAGEFFNDKVGVIDTFPREIGRGKTLVLKGTLKGAYKTPELILIAPRGKTYLNKEQVVNGQEFAFTVRFEEGPGPYRLELIAHTTEATRSAARFTVWHASPKPEVETEEPLPTGPTIPWAVHVRVLEKRFLRRLNDFRTGIGCEPVLWNEAVAARAREHAEHMAEALRRQHRFGGTGVLEMLKTDGAGQGGLSGPATPWGRTNSVRPFGRPAPGPPGPALWNHVVVQNVQGASLEQLFERHFVREAAFRICAADPNCLEVAVGASRIALSPPVPGKPPPPGGSEVFFCVCFIQVNEKPLIRVQDDAFDDLLRRGKAREPDVLRALGMWGRPKAMDLLARALEDRKPEVAAAAFDGLLLLDEDAARARFAALALERDLAIQEGRYGDAVAPYGLYTAIQYDKEIALGHATALRAAREAAAHEIGALSKMAQEERARAAADLKRRSAGLDLDADIDRVAAKSG